MMIPMRCLNKRGRGIAIPMVMLTVAMVFVLGLTFLNKTSSSSAASNTYRNYVTARLVAESGLEATLKYIEESTTWRTDQVNGTWVTDQAFGGGTFTVICEDGYDVDNDGVVDGDGDLADDESDFYTITVLGTVDGVTHKLQVVSASPVGDSLILVNDKAEIKDNGLIDSYNSTSGAYGPGNQGSNAQLAGNYVGKANFKLKDHAVLNGHIYFPEGGNPELAMDISGSPLHTGSYKSFSSEYEIPDYEMPVLATVLGDVKYGDETVDLMDDFECTKLELDKTEMIVFGKRTIVVKGDITMKGTTQIRLDQTPTNHGNEVEYSTEETADGVQAATMITITEEIEASSISAYIKGNNVFFNFAIYSDDGNKPGELIVEGKKEKGTSNTAYWHTMEIDTTTLTPGTYWLAITCSNRNGYYHYDANAEPVDQLHIINGSGVNGFNDTWSVSNSTEQAGISIYLTAEPDSSLTIYSSAEHWHIEDTTEINTDVKDPDRVVFINIDCEKAPHVDLKNDSITYATVISPDGELKLKDKAQFFGKGRIYKLKAEQEGQLNVDTTGGEEDPGMVVDMKVELKGDSIVTSYGGGKDVLYVNSIGEPVIKLDDNAIVKGDAYGGSGGAGNTVSIKVGTNATLTGKQGILPEVIPIEIPEAPDFATFIGDVKADRTTVTLSSNANCKKIEIKEDGILKIDGDVTLVLEGDIQCEKNGQLIITEGSKLTVYASKSVEIKDDAMLNVNGKTSQFVFYYTHDKIELKNRSQLAAELIAPNCELKVKDDSHFYGLFMGRKLKVEKRGQFHHDVQGGSLEGGVRWVLPRL